MSRSVTALDLGGTHVVAGRVDLSRATVVRGARVDLPEDADRNGLLALIVGAAREVFGDSNRVACAVPGPFDYARGVSWVGHKLEPLYGVDLAIALATGLDLDRAAISFVNDADAFLLGESWAGAAVGHARAAGVTLGTGLGSAFLADGRIVAHGPAVPPDGEIHRVSYRGRPIEETISRQALIGSFGDPSVDVEDLAALARAGDPRARAAFAYAGAALGEALAPWLSSFAATCLVVGGSIAGAWELLENLLREALAGITTLEAVLPAVLLDDAALLGAGLASEQIVVRHSPGTAAQVATWRDERLAAGAHPVHELRVAEARVEQAAEPILGETESAELDTVDLDGPVPIRLYRRTSDDRLPLFVWLPGGGWVLDTLAGSEPVCRRLALETPCAVAAVRYRLAPEHPFPIPVEDTLAAIRWLVGQARELGLDAKRVVVGGASAGGNLAAAVTLTARDTGGSQLAAQVLVYPVLARDPETHSRHAYADPAFFGRGDVDWCWSHYLARDEDATSPLASPLLAETFAGLPPALVVTAELDPLRDEGELYADRLRAAGVPVECVRFAGVPHGFFSRSGLDAADDAQLLVIETLRAAFAARSTG